MKDEAEIFMKHISIFLKACIHQSFFVSAMIEIDLLSSRNKVSRAEIIEKKYREDFTIKDRGK